MNIEKYIELQSWVVKNHIPIEIETLKEIKILDLSEHNLTNIPNAIDLLSNLNELFLNDNRIKTLPNSITNLKNLKVLELNNNYLTKLPKDIGELNNLLNLTVKNNKLSILPNSIVNLKSLIELDLSTNNISNLPKDISKLRQLSIFNIYNNQLKERPYNIDYFSPDIKKHLINESPDSFLSIIKNSLLIPALALPFTIIGISLGLFSILAMMSGTNFVGVIILLILSGIFFKISELLKRIIPFKKFIQKYEDNLEIDFDSKIIYLYPGALWGNKISKSDKELIENHPTFKNNNWRFSSIK